MPQMTKIEHVLSFVNTSFYYLIFERSASSSSSRAILESELF